MNTMVVDVGAHALGRAALACLPELQTWDKPVGNRRHQAPVPRPLPSLLRGRSISFPFAEFRWRSIQPGPGRLLQHEPGRGGACQGHRVACLPTMRWMLLLPHLSTLVLQVRRNVQLFCSPSGNKELSKLVLTGGSLLPGPVGAARQRAQL